ncbi:MAG: diguanylate cyclase [Deltaproteobacteria bacterium]|nr:diguanylate cyclase [Deltaproteobacteria bacterium]
MPNKKLFIISDSPDVRSLFDQALARFDGVQTTWLDSFYPAVKLLEQSSATLFALSPEVVVIDLSTVDFQEPHIRQRFTRLGKDLVILAILPGKTGDEEGLNRLGRIEPFDVLMTPFTTVEIRYRLQAAFAFAESRAGWRFFETVAAGIGTGLLVVDEGEKILWLNSAAEKLLKYERDALAGWPLSLVIGTEEAANIFASDMPRSFTIRMTRRDCSRFPAGCFAGIIRLPEGQGFTLVFSDVSEEKKREDELLLSAKVFEFSGEAIMITDAADKILAANPAFEKMTGYPAGEVAGRKPDFLNSGRQDDHFYEKMWAAVHRHGHWTGEVWNRLENGRIRPMWTAISAVKNLAGEPDHYVTILSDITDRLAEEKHLRHLAQHDFLTGLPNRVLLKDRFSQAAANASRDGRKIAVLFLDLDKFKAINDRNGHTVGDRLLQQLAERLLACLRSTDTASRWGGDEFVLLFPGIMETGNISGIVGKISRTLQQPFTVNGDVYSLSASIGVSFFPDHGADLDELLAHADSAMYAAKDMAGGSFAVFTKNN